MEDTRLLTWTARHIRTHAHTDADTDVEARHSVTWHGQAHGDGERDAHLEVEFALLSCCRRDRPEDQLSVLGRVCRRHTASGTHRQAQEGAAEWAWDERRERRERSGEISFNERALLDGKSFSTSLAADQRNDSGERSATRTVTPAPSTAAAAAVERSSPAIDVVNRDCLFRQQQQQTAMHWLIH